MSVDPKDYDTKHMRLMRERDEALTRAEKAEHERDALRLIVTEKFAGADMYVRPEDALDVARWAAHPEAVRLLLLLPHYAPNETCRDCGADVDESHGQTFDHPRNPQWCRIAAAWHTLGDPRGAADIERAHEEALREQDRHARDLLPYSARHHSVVADGGWLGDSLFARGETADEVVAQLSPGGAVLTATRDIVAGDLLSYELGPGGVPRGPVYRLASEPQPARRTRGDQVLDLPAQQSRRVEMRQRWCLANGWTPQQAAHDTARNDSDARGMEAVEAEARDLDADANAHRAFLRHAALARSVGREPFEP